MEANQKKEPTETSAEFVLPASLTGSADLGRLIREIEQVEGVLEAEKVRGSVDAARHTALSQSLQDFVAANKLDMADTKTLAATKDRLRKLKDHAPVIHLTFASEVDPYLLQQLVMWLRENVDPRILVGIGRQPSLIGGVYMRTPNHIFDFSLKALLKDKRPVILNELEALRAR